jgi:MSHA biogenesis protein MshO
VIVVLGVVATSFGFFVLPAINAQQAVARRAELTDAGESALRLIARDIRIALPNSVRGVRVTNFVPAVGHTAFAVEIIPTADGGRYCTTDTADCNSADVLSIGSADSVFDILGQFRNQSFLLPAGTNAWRLVVNSSDSSIYTATGASAVLTPVVTTTVTTVSSRHRVTLGAAHTFPTGSPRQRVFVIQDASVPVSYVCSSLAGTVVRYAGYKDGLAYSTTTQPTDPSAPPLNAIGRTVVGKVSACNAASLEATVQQSAVVTLTIALTDSGETVQLLKQIHIDNSQ